MNLTPEQQRERLAQTVQENARIQKTAENRENYFKSCEKHGGMLAEVVQKIREWYSKLEIV